ncbi:VOC family protein [bacterium]|nr:VOC family protein [bacterium]
MEQSKPVHHSINYIEFPVSDMAETKRFYAAAFGWTFNDYGPDYAGVVTQGREVGGFRREERVTAGGPLVVLYSNDLTASLARVREAGCLAQEPYDFPGGRRFHFNDPNGNELAVWSDK